MCNNFPNIRITEGNNFSIILPLLSRTYVATRPIDEEIDPEQLQNVVVTFGGVTYPAQLTERGVQINLPATLAVGTYNILLTAEYLGSNIRAAYESAVTIVPWSEQSTAEQYIAGSPIVLRAAYVLSGAMTDAELEALKEEYREKNAQLDQAIADAEAAKHEWEEKAADLDGVAQEATSQSILTAVENIDFSTLAKETTAQEARDAALALAPVAQAAEAYNTGKVQLAQNITAKGVAASASETLPELAGKVSAISQQPIILSPSEVGDMYAVQQFGSITAPNYWNLYEVLNTLLNDGRLLNYGGILLAEYYKGYDSITLSGAGSGGAYVVSDMENGVFKMYTNDTTHVWATEDDGKGNRWVAYCFASAGHPFDIIDTNTSPRAIHIGRHVGVLRLLTSTRCAEIVVTDGNLLDDIQGNYAQKFNGKVVIRNINNHTSGALFYNPVNVESVYVQLNKLDSNIFYLQAQNVNIPVVIIECNEMRGQLGQSPNRNHLNMNTLILKGNILDFAIVRAGSQAILLASPLHIAVVKSEYVRLRWDLAHVTSSDGSSIYFGYETNDKTKDVALVSVYGPNGCAWNYVNDIILQDGWNKPIDVHLTEKLTEANMYAHILQRLKQDEADCGDGVTITLGATNLAKLTSAESVQLLDDLTNIYGYTFA